MRLSGELVAKLNIIRKLIVNIKVVEENQEWNRCIDENGLTLERCRISDACTTAKTISSVKMTACPDSKQDNLTVLER